MDSMHDCDAKVLLYLKFCDAVNLDFDLKSDTSRDDMGTTSPAR